MRFSEMNYVKPGVVLKVVEAPAVKAIEIEGKKETLYNVTLLKKHQNEYKPAYFDICGEAFDNIPVELYLSAEEVEDTIAFVKRTEEQPELTSKL